MVSKLLHELKGTRQASVPIDCPDELSGLGIGLSGFRLQAQL